MEGPKIQTHTNDVEKGLSPHRQHDPKCELRVNMPSTYHDQVKLKLQHLPWLESLDQFMDHDAEGFAMSLHSRMKHFDIKVFHIPKSGKPISPIKCTSLEEFEEAFTAEGDRAGTLLIAKGISRIMIEALGTRFDLEPEFFASYLQGTELFRMGRRISPLQLTPARAPKFSPQYIRTAPFYATEYWRPYHVEGGQESVFKLRSTKTSTPRGVQIIKIDFPEVFVMEKISVYKKKGSNIGIILTDQLLLDVLPASHILEPISSIDEETNNLSSARWHQVSTRRELTSWLQHLPPDEAKSLFDDRKQLALSPALKMVEKNGIMFLAHAHYLMGRILTRHCDADFPNSMPLFVHVSRSLHRYIHAQQRNLRYALRVAALHGGEDIEEQKLDFGFLASDMDATLKALEEDVRFLVGEASVQEGKVVGWVSKFAALFLPVSLLATILSINGTGFVRWAVLGCLSVPFVLISAYFMFYWKPEHFNT